VAIKIDMLRNLCNSAVDYFVQYEPRSAPVLYHRAGCQFDASHLAVLDEAGVSQIYVRSGDLATFGNDLLKADKMVPPAERFAALQLAYAVEIERAAHLVDCGQYVALAEKVACDLTEMLNDHDALPRDLFRLARHDFNTFTHVTNVTCYAVILAIRLGTCSHSEMERFAIGAMLHDIGKRFIPVSILTKPTRLMRKERALIETHPQRGYEDLCYRPQITREQLLMVYQHHERIDGSGYPVGITGKEIHPWAKILAVVDVFDAMTGSRPYRRSTTPWDALRYIQRNAGTHFDPEVVQCWQEVLVTA
jgi:HD-GYP domain-containing protein (c-di-GMP phosphodiesterase class II)